MGVRKKKNDRKVTVGFTIPREVRDGIEELALMEKLTISEFLRKMVEGSLQDRLKREFDSMQFESVKREIKELRECLAVVTEALLTTAGGMKLQEAEKWVNREIRS